MLRPRKLSNEQAKKPINRLSSSLKTVLYKQKNRLLIDQVEHDNIKKNYLKVLKQFPQLPTEEKDFFIKTKCVSLYWRFIFQYAETTFKANTAQHIQYFYAYSANLQPYIKNKQYSLISGLLYASVHQAYHIIYENIRGLAIDEPELATIDNLFNGEITSILSQIKVYVQQQNKSRQTLYLKSLIIDALSEENIFEEQRCNKFIAISQEVMNKLMANHYVDDEDGMMVVAADAIQCFMTTKCYRCTEQAWSQEQVTMLKKFLQSLRITFSNGLNPDKDTDGYRELIRTFLMPIGFARKAYATDDFAKAIVNIDNFLDLTHKRNFHGYWQDYISIEVIKDYRYLAILMKAVVLYQQDNRNGQESLNLINSIKALFFSWSRQRAVLRVAKNLQSVIKLERIDPNNSPILSLYDQQEPTMLFFREVLDELNQNISSLELSNINQLSKSHATLLNNYNSSPKSKNPVEDHCDIYDL